MSLSEIIHFDELFAAKVSISLSIDHLLLHVPLAVASLELQKLPVVILLLLPNMFLCCFL